MRALLAFSLAAFLLAACEPKGEPVKIDIAFKLTDEDYHPLVGVPVRVVAGIPGWRAGEWQAPDAGVRIVTDKNGEAHVTTEGRIDRQWKWEPVGFTPLSIPLLLYHTGVAFEAERVLPSKHGYVAHHWLYTADIWRYGDGSCSTFDVDRIYDMGSDKRFSRLIMEGASSPEAHALVDGLMMGGAGFRLWDFEIDPVGDAKGAKEWRLKLSVKELPKPVLRE